MKHRIHTYILKKLISLFMILSLKKSSRYVDYCIILIDYMQEETNRK